MRDYLFYLARRAFTSASVHVKPLVHQGPTRSEREIRQGSEKYKDMRGDMMIQGLWDPQANAIIDIKLGDSELDYHTYPS